LGGEIFFRQRSRTTGHLLIHQLWIALVKLLIGGSKIFVFFEWSRGHAVRMLPVPVDIASEVFDLFLFPNARDKFLSDKPFTRGKLRIKIHSM